jgi:hypothetical protein
MKNITTHTLRQLLLEQLIEESSEWPDNARL